MTQIFSEGARAALFGKICIAYYPLQHHAPGGVQDIYVRLVYLQVPRHVHVPRIPLSHPTPIITQPI